MQKHPTEELYIWNYMNSVAYDGSWDEITETCRGIITDGQGNVVARPFPKFFNIGQKEAETVNWKQPFKVWEKKDCYLGIGYWVDGKMHLASRGSFESDFAVAGNKILNSVERGWIDSDKNYTFLFEIILKDKPIVLTYPEDELCLLAVVETETGNELDPREFNERLKFTIPKLYEFSSIEDIMNSEQRLGEEGYVVHFADGNRIKWKFEDYCRLHSVVTRSTERHVWEYLKDGRKEELFSIIPDEFYPQLHKCIQHLETQFTDWEFTLDACYWHTYWKLYYANNEVVTKKDLALYGKDNIHKTKLGYVFALYDFLSSTDEAEKERIKKRLDNIVWDKIYPEGRTLLEWTNLIPLGVVSNI